MRMLSAILAVPSLLWLATMTPKAVALDQPGLVDESFDPGAGPEGQYVPRVQTLHWLPGERILMQGNFTSVDGAPRRQVAILNPDGSLDESFDVQLSEDELIDVAAVGGDGMVYLGYRMSWSLDTLLTRRAPDGSVDPNFQLELDGTASAMIVQPDGKVVFNLSKRIEDFAYTNRLVRLNTDGSPDPSFGTGLSVDNTKHFAFVSRLTLQADGKFLVGGGFSVIGGTTRENLARVNPDGTVDLQFAPALLGGMTEAIALQADGKIIAANVSYTNSQKTYVVRRLNDDGSLDATFHAVFGPAYGSATIALRSLLPQGDGRILVGGAELHRIDPDAFTSFGVVRLGLTGALDLSFASDFQLQSALLQADGRVVIAGDSFEINGRELSIARLLNDADVGAGRLEFDVSSFEVTEAAEPTITLVVRRSIASHGALKVGYGVSGTARPGADFSLSGNLLAFEDGDAAPRTITLQIHEDALAEGTETIRVMLGSPIGGATLGTRSFVDIRILDNDVAVEAGAPVYRVWEREAEALVEVTRSGMTNSAFSVEFLTMPGTATAGMDYHPQKCLLDFAIGETNKVVRIPIIDDGRTEYDETFRFALRGPTDGTLLGANSEATVVILDNDRPGTLDDRFQPDFFGFAVSTLAVQPDGRILLGGRFADPFDQTGQTNLGLVRLLPDGALDGSFDPADLRNPSSDYSVATAIFPQADGKLLVGIREVSYGAFKPYGLHVRLVRLLEDGTLDESFSTVVISAPPGFGLGEQTITKLITQPDGRIIMGGVFDTVNGVVRVNIARVLVDGDLDTTFDPGIGPFRVYALALQADGQILVGGLFDEINGVPLDSLARLNTDGSLDTTFDCRLRIGSNDRGMARALLVLPDGRVMAGGYFNRVNGVPRQSLARLHPDGSLDLSFEGNLMACEVGLGWVVALARQPDGKILVGGDFCHIHGVSLAGLARLNADGSLDAGFTPDIKYGGASAVASEPNGQILAAGSFTLVDGIERLGLVRLNGGVFHFEFHSAVRLANGRAHLNFAMPRGQSWFLQASADLVQWFYLNAARPLRDSTEFTDVTSPGSNQRFYRALQVP